MEWKIPLALVLLCAVFWSGWELKKLGRELDRKSEGILLHRLNHFYNLGRLYKSRRKE